VDPNLAIIVAGITVTLYSALGGIKSVTTTDKLQLATFLIAIPYILLIVIDETFYKGFSSTGAPPLFDIKPGTFSTDNPKFWDIMFIGLWFIFPSMHPVFCQRIMMAKNVAQAKVAFKYSAYLIIFVTMLLGLIALMVYNYDPNIADNRVISYIIDNFTTAGLKGFLIVGVIAMAMSTADSFINISAVLFANDLCIPLKLFKNKELFISRSFAALLGLGSIYLALSDKDLLSIIVSTNKYYKPIVTAPILLTIFGFRTSIKSIMLGIIAGLFVVTFVPGNEISVSLTAILSNTLVVLCHHYLFKQKGGWTKIEMDEEEIDMRSAEQIAADEEAARMEKLKWQIAGNNQQLFDELEKTLKDSPQNIAPTNKDEAQAIQNIVARLKKQGLPKDIISKITGLPQTEI
jgi:Na+/proline symporter